MLLEHFGCNELRILSLEASYAPRRHKCLGRYNGRIDRNRSRRTLLQSPKRADGNSFGARLDPEVLEGILDVVLIKSHEMGDGHHCRGNLYPKTRFRLGA